MSAIWGIFRFDGAAVAAVDLQRIGATMAARSADGRATYIDGPVGLGHGLMRITREDAFDQQPLYDRDAGLVLVADCRIDNREQIALALAIDANILETMPDSAVILQAYRRWGDECVDHLIGDFAFAIWDARAKRLFLARDPMGQRALHYHLGEGFVAFATDIAALWAAPEVPRRLDEVWLGHFANHWRTPLAGRTALDGIRSLCGGTHIAIGHDGAVVEQRYWTPHADPAHVGHDDAYYVAMYRTVLAEAVACRVRRLVDPPGLSLSGGFDSGSIAALAGPALPDGDTLVTVTSAMPEREGGWPHDPRPWVELCKRDMPHLDVHYVEYHDRNPLDGLEAQFAAHGGGPVSPSSQADIECYAALRAQGVRLVMDGHGGDYTLNDRGGMALAHLAGQGRLRALLTEIGAHRRATGESWPSIAVRRLALPLLPEVLRGLINAAGRGFRRKRSVLILQSSFIDRLVRAGDILPPARFSARETTRDSRSAKIDLLVRLSSQAPAMAGMAAAQGLDLTRPFHDRRVVEFALAVPQHLDVRGGRNRYLACSALADILPFEFQSRARSNDRVIDDPLSIDPISLRAAVAQLANSPAAEYFDLARLDDTLRESSDRSGANLPARRQQRHDALRSIIFARYVAWMSSRNG